MTKAAPRSPIRRSDRTATETKALGFGFLPERGEHHFLVTMPKTGGDQVIISEHLTWEETTGRRELSLALGREDDKIRVLMPRRKWDAIAEPLQLEFNLRLKKLGLASGRWSKTWTPVSRLLGKEMTLLAWAIEEADPALIPTAVRNWQGLAPEERWWLYTMTNAATGHALNGRNKGWRKAVRFALTENPATVEGDGHREEFFGLIRESPSSL
jgi:hypothetical protein